MNQNNHAFDTDEIEKKCYLLLSCCLSEKPLTEFCQSLSEHGIPNISFMIQATIKRYLADIAIQVRMIDDLMKSRDKTHHVPEFTVGEITSQKNSELTIRESCNKIIHAISIEIKANEAVLIGQHYKSEWAVKINIKDFIKAALFVVNRFEEDWDVSAIT